MRMGLPKIHIGLRTVKTTAAIVISMIVVDHLGTSASKLIFAMLGAMAAVQPTFNESLESCMTQIVGVLFGAVAGIALRALNLHPLVATGVGIILVITLYNTLKLRYSPGIPCFIVVMLCTTPDIQPIPYALGRIWDTAIGLAIGMLINTLIFPYDNSRRIRAIVKSLDEDVLQFLEELFDGDDILPQSKDLTKKIDDIAYQLSVFSNQKLVLNLKRQKKDLETFRLCSEKARELVAQLEVLHRLGAQACLNEENRQLLEALGTKIRDDRRIDTATQVDIIANYHVGQVLLLRKELLEAIRK